MKQLIVTVATILALIIFFFIVEHREIFRYDNIKTVQSASVTSNREQMTFAFDTKLMAEVKPAVDTKSATEQKKDSSIKVDSPFAVPVLSPEEAIIANSEAIVAYYQRPTVVRQNEDLHDLDFRKDVVAFLLYLIPVSILLYFLFLKRFFQKLRIRRKIIPPKIIFSYSPLMLLLFIVFIQWINVFCNQNTNDYDSIFYEKKVISPNDEWSSVNDKLCQVQISYAFKIASPTLFVDDLALQELSLPDLKRMMQESELQLPCFALNRGWIVVPKIYKDKIIHVYAERQIFNFIKKYFSIRGCLKMWLLVFALWFCMQIYINNGLVVVAKKAFRQKCLLVCLTSFSIILAGAFWMSHIPPATWTDGKEYISLSSANTIMRCLYYVRTPGYPLFLSLINFFSPLSFHSTIYFQILFYLLSLTWLLYEVYKRGVPMILVLFAYYLFYDYPSDFFFSILCETLEMSSIAALAAIGLSMSEAIIKKRTVKFVVLLILAIFLVFYAMMIKPFPGLILLPGCMMFLGLLGTIRFRKAFILTVFVGILSVLLPASYCALRWKLCGDFNFCSLINTICGAYQLTVSTPQSLSSNKISSEQRELAFEVIDYFEKNRPDLNLEYPWLNNDASLYDMQKIRQELIYRGGIEDYFKDKWKTLDTKQKERYVEYFVFTNDQCKAFLKAGDPELRKIMMKHYWNEAFRLYSSKNPRFIPKTLKDYNPFQSSKYFHRKVTFPLIIFLLITCLPLCRKTRYGSWKTLIIIVGFSMIPFITFAGQVYWLDSPVFEGRSEMVMFFSTLLGSILLSMYCIYSYIISLILALRLLYLRFAPEKLKCFISDAINTAFSYFKRVIGALIQLVTFLKTIRIRLVS